MPDMKKIKSATNKRGKEVEFEAPMKVFDPVTIMP